MTASGYARHGIALGLLLAACDPPPLPAIAAAEHARIIADWHMQRLDKLQQPDGWLALAGLYWLKPGSNTFGGDSANDFVYPGAAQPTPSRIGTFTLENGTVRFDAEPDVSVTHGDTVITSRVVFGAGLDRPPLLHHGTLEWLIIARADRIGVRLRDAASPVRTEFAGIDRFPVAVAWRFPARFIQREPPDTIEVPNILGTTNHTAIPGIVEFRYHGRKRRLALWKDADDPANFFTAFGDSTNGRGTYGGGRFLWVDAPDAQGRTIVDFNKAYNPPCVFTDFATCPLPPRQNRLPFPIAAGERVWSGHH
jgi:uncharacterized protein (DUF1684 family)